MSSPSAQINNSVQERVKKVRGLEATTQKELSLKLVNECWPSVVAGDETIPRSTGFEQICSRFHTTALKPNSSILRMLEICLRGEDSGAVLRLYQLLIFQVMTEILHLRLGDSVMTISGPASETAVPVVLSETEEQALRYACGYIPFSLIKHYKKYPKNEFAIASITALQNWHDLTKNGTDTDDPGESFMSYTKTWLKLIDRGKLFSVSDEAYRFFHATEVVVKQYLNSKNIKKLSKVKNVKEELMATTGKNKAVSDTWEILTSKVNPQVSEHLRLRVLRKFIDMRCNSFCSVYLVCKKLANPDSVSARAEKSLRTQLLYCKKQ